MNLASTRWFTEIRHHDHESNTVECDIHQ